MLLVCQTTPVASVTGVLLPPTTNVRTGVSPHHRVHQDRLCEMRPWEVLDLHIARPKPDEEREQLEEQIHGEEPAQVVRERHAEVASALLPDPLVLDRRGPWVKSQVPHDHDKCGNERNCKSQENAGPAAE